MDGGADTARDSGVTSGRASTLVVVIGGTWAVLHALGLLGPLADATFVLLAAAAFFATLFGIRRHDPQVRRPWWLICAALGLFLVGGAAREAMGTLGDLTASRSLVPDLITLPGYAVLALGLTGLASARNGVRRRDSDAILDGVVAALAVLTLAWVFFINPVLFHEHAPLPVRLVLAAYPPMSAFLVAVVARMLFSTSRTRVVADRLLMCGLGMMLTGDIVYMVVDAHLAALPDSVIDLPYALAYVAFTAVVAHPTMRDVCAPSAPEETPATRPRLAIVAAALGVPAVVTASRQEALPGDRIVLSAIILALTAAAVLRVFRALQAHARAEARLAHRATHDALTELPNRLYVRDYVGAALRRASASGRQVALLFLDVDRFKLVNDTYGHTLGDELLVEAASRLTQTLRPRDFVARIGGDEFVVVVDDVTDHDEAIVVADRIRAAFQAPYTIRGIEMFASVSVGVACANGLDPDVDAETLIRDADTAMYQAKAAGRDAVAMFDASMRDRTAERLALELDLRHALERGELHLNFQPIVQAATGSVDGVEALLRWSHPTRGLVPPDAFVSVAEDSGLIVEIGSWVLRESCRHVSAWRRALPTAGNLHVAVNLSARQLRDPGLVDLVAEALTEFDLPPDALWLEITESMLMENPTAATDILSALRDLGVGLSIDDFGTGYSSLAYLKRFPVDRVKIDRSFVEGLDRRDSSEESLVAAIIAMAGALGMTTIAEGVETVGQQQRLTMLGCEFAQGHFYAPAVAPRHVPGTLVSAVRPELSRAN